MSDVRVVKEDGSTEMIDYRSAFLRSEAMLRMIDIIAAPDRRGRRSKHALDRIQDMVMTRPWQSAELIDERISDAVRLRSERSMNRVFGPGPK